MQDRSSITVLFFSRTESLSKTESRDAASCQSNQRLETACNRDYFSTRFRSNRASFDRLGLLRVTIAVLRNSGVDSISRISLWRSPNFGRLQVVEMASVRMPTPEVLQLIVLHALDKSPILDTRQLALSLPSSVVVDGAASLSGTELVGAELEDQMLLKGALDSLEAKEVNLLSSPSSRLLLCWRSSSHTSNAELTLGTTADGQN